jgi:hypothetical protein
MKVYAEGFFCGWKIECSDCGLHTDRCASGSEAVAKWNEMTKGAMTNGEKYKTAEERQ